MGAKLISPEGNVLELSIEQYIELKLQMISHLPIRMERWDALFNLIEETREEGDDVWWEEFEQFLKDNPITFPEPDLD